MKKQTAVEWIEEVIDKRHMGSFLKSLIEKAKAMEKEQIIDAHFAAQKEDLRFWDEAKQEALEYYNETYKKL